MQRSIINLTRNSFAALNWVGNDELRVNRTGQGNVVALRTVCIAKHIISHITKVKIYIYIYIQGAAEKSPTF